MHLLSKFVRILKVSKDLSNRRPMCIQNYNIEKYRVNDTTNALEHVTEDLSEFAPHFPATYNLAAYVNKSDLLQNLVHLDVNLSKIEKKPYLALKILKLDFDQDVKKHIMFIKDYVESDHIGKFITENPLILCEPLEDLEVRVNYLVAKNFSDNQIKSVVSRNPFWLMFSTARIDKRLGYFQDNFQLQGDEVRYLSAKQPKLITYNLHHVKTNQFVLREELGFEEAEVKNMVLYKPKLLMINQRALYERFNYIHNVIKIPHSMLLQFPEVLLCRNFKVKQRHLFLQKLGRAQFDPLKENYVPIKALVEGSDSEFCNKYAKCNVGDFNIFLKTL